MKALLFFLALGTCALAHAAGIVEMRQIKDYRVVVINDTSPTESQIDAIIKQVCPLRGGPCLLGIWSDRKLAPTSFPIHEYQSAAQVAYFKRDLKSRETYAYNCAVVPIAHESDCMAGSRSKAKK